MDQATFIFDILIPNLGEGFLFTLALIALSAPCGLLVGMGVAAGRVYGTRPLRILAKGYVVFFKGCPLLLLLFILYFGLPSLGLPLGAFLSAVLGFIFCNSAYNSEFIRGAIHSIKEGQFTAAQALGMSRGQVIRYIIMPQAVRKAFPGIMNEFIYLIKFSSLAYMITVIELTGAGKMIATKYFMFTETFFILGLVYLVLVSVTTVAAHFIEKKYRIIAQ